MAVHTFNEPKLEPLSVGFFNGKGGVGKTTTTANVGGLAAAAGSRALIIDMDPQGNLSRDLGYEPRDGSELFSALLAGTAPPMITNVGGREGLDVVPGGAALFDLSAVMISRQQRSTGATLGEMLLTSIRFIEHDYDLIVFDTPPGDLAIIDAVMEIVSAVVIPVRPDDASIDGLETIATRFQYAREGDPVRRIPASNPLLQLAGVLLFGVGSRSTKLEAQVRESISDIIGDAAPVFESRIRYMESTAYDARHRGLLIHELELRAEDAKVKRFAALRLGHKTQDALLTRNASGLAEDFQHLTREILIRLSELAEHAQKQAEQLGEQEVSA
jgi:chromosome partitioning protein